MARLELPDGQWADQVTSPNHRQNRAILSAAERAQRGSGTFTDWASVVGFQMTTAWYVRGDDGKPIDLDESGWDEAPAAIVDAICGKAQELWRGWNRNRRPLVPIPALSADTSPVE